MPTTGCENSDKDCRHSEKLTSEGEAGHAKQQEEGCDLRDTLQGLPLCVHWRDRENLGETPSKHKAAVKKNDPKNGIAVHASANSTKSTGKLPQSSKRKGATGEEGS